MVSKRVLEIRLNNLSDRVLELMYRFDKIVDLLEMVSNNVEELEYVLAKKK